MKDLFLYFILLVNFFMLILAGFSTEYAGIFFIALAVFIIGLFVTESFIVPMVKDLYKMYKNREILPEGTHAVNLGDSIKFPKQKSVNIK